MLKRTITALILAAVFIPICYFSYTPVWPIVMSLLSLFAAYEMLDCVGLKKNAAVAVPSYLVGAIVPLLPLLMGGDQDHCVAEISFAIFVVYLIVLYILVVFSPGKLDYMNAACGFMGVFYTTVCFTCLVLLRGMGNTLYLLVFIGPWTSDIFAYLCGRFFGKHKLIPEVSPKKTVEGSIGGILFTSVAFVAYAIVMWKVKSLAAFPNLILFAVVGALISLIGQIGDLTASAIKRRFNIKDYGFIFPGHGGVLDRFDSVLLAAPAMYILAELPLFSSILL